MKRTYDSFAGNTDANRTVFHENPADSPINIEDDDDVKVVAEKRNSNDSKMESENIVKPHESTSLQYNANGSITKNTVNQSIRQRTFHPAFSTRFVIPSVRMGPPYPGTHQFVPVNAPTVLRPRFQPHMVYRNRRFSPETDRSRALTIIHVDDTTSSSETSGNSSDEGVTEDEMMKVDNVQYVINENPQPAQLTQQPLIKLESKAFVKATMSIGQSRIIEPITIEDSDEDETISPHSRSKTAKISIPSSPVKSLGCSPEVKKLIDMLPGSDGDEDIFDIMSYGMSMLNSAELLKAISPDETVEKPKRVNLKGLYSQIKHGSLKKVVAFLRAGANPLGSLKGEDGKTGLHVAAAKGHLDILLVLLYKVGRQKADCKDHFNRTPLFLAVERKHINVAQLLVYAGANSHVKNAEGMNLLHVAARRGHLPLVKWLVNIGIPLNEQDNFGWTSLMWAAENDANSSLISYLIRKGALTNLLDNECNICLHWSAIAGSLECCKVLLSSSADSNVNVRNKFGETPLHVAAKGDHFHVTQYLLLNDADHTIKNKNNSTPLDVCPAGSKTFHCIRIRNEVGKSRHRYNYVPDISFGKERIPVSCLNEVDDEPYPCDFVYITKPEESIHVVVRRGLSTIKPCTCQGSCHSTCKCIILSEKQKLWYTEDGRLDLMIFEHDSPVLYECTSLCSCWNYCSNRVVQKGLQYPLQVYKTMNKGWGLRALTRIPVGAFILSYVGELITDEEAERRNKDTYLFNLDLKTSGDEPNCMDALRYGNCGRFINHSCDANMRAVKLFTAHRDVSFPEVAFFAYRDIEAKEELSFNYGDSFWDVKMDIGLYCKCETAGCLYRRP